MLTRIEYLRLKLIYDSASLRVGDEEKNFILEKRIRPAHTLLVNRENLLHVITKMGKVFTKLQKIKI